MNTGIGKIAIAANIRPKPRMYGAEKRRTSTLIARKLQMTAHTIVKARAT